MASYRQSERNKQNLVTVSSRDTGAVKYTNQKSDPQKHKTTLPVQRDYLPIALVEIRILFNVLLFFQQQITQLVRSCKQKPWREKFVMPVGDYRWIPDR